MGCPTDAVCQTCPCAAEDDVCFPGERLRGSLRRIATLARDQHEDAEILLDEILAITEREVAT